MRYRTYGEEFTLSLEDDGSIYCSELGIRDKDLEVVKELIRTQVKKEKAAPRIKILTTGSWNVHNEKRFFEGTTTNVTDRGGYRWVAWRDDRDRPIRKKLSSSAIYLDTPANRELLTAIIVKNLEMNSISRQVTQLEAQLRKIDQPDED